MFWKIDFVKALKFKNQNGIYKKQDIETQC